MFPVPDGDTGNNLASTLGNVPQGALSRRSRHIGELLARIGNDAIDGARGNSGAIMAQFLVGPVRAGATHRCWMRGAGRGATGADSARVGFKPVEGTILSVISAFADAARRGPQARASSDDPRTGFTRALQQARTHWRIRPGRCRCCRRPGGRCWRGGFVDWLEGIAEYVEGDGPRAMRSAGRARGWRTMPARIAHLHEDVDPDCRYCTECLVLGEGIDREALQAALVALGVDSRSSPAAARGCACMATSAARRRCSTPCARMARSNR